LKIKNKGHSPRLPSGILLGITRYLLLFRAEKFKYENYSLRHNNLDLKEELLDLRQKHTELIAENAILKNQIIPGISAKVRSEINKRIEKEEG
jgi:hypothetical protein